MRYIALFPCLFFLFSILVGCNAHSNSNKNPEKRGVEKKPIEIAAPAQFEDYWYQGQAELNRFQLRQTRYGEVHEGEAVLIFVTEDFLTQSQVKKERSTDESAATVLKLNAVHKFTTGLYDYSMMASVFSPVSTDQYPHTLKVTMSSQDWCGQSFVQMNLHNDHYRVKQYSYFQAEGDTTYKHPAVWLEDELWTKLRLKPEALPTDTFRVIPGTKFTRLRHVSDHPRQAVGTRSVYEGSQFPGDSLQVYRLHYPELERTLKIYYSAHFPYRIAGWQDMHPSGFGESSQSLTTTAIRTSHLVTDYWNKNAVKDSTWRQKLGAFTF
jgi:hypothetical protein